MKDNNTKISEFISFNDFSDKKENIYNALWLNSDFEVLTDKVKIEKTSYKGSKSNNSYSFVSINGADIKLDIIKDAFNIADNKLFDQKFEKAITGSGQEKDKITVLHSSSLCAFLHFYNIDDNPLEISFTTDKGIRNIIFNYSTFEVQSPVIDEQYPSNMDVVLCGYDVKDETKKYVLMLESKFAEYYINAGCTSDISKSYIDDKANRNKLFLEVMNSVTDKAENTFGLMIEKDLKDDNKYKLKSDEPYYIGGIKQMISHYMGVNNLIKKLKNGDYYRADDQKEVEEAIKNGATVILGEILFDYKIGDLTIGRSKKKCLKEYSERYKIFAEKIKELNVNGDSQFEIIMEDLKYSQIKDILRLDSQVKDFYYGN